MCIAVYKPEGQKMPSKKIFSNCFSNNSDGAGFMFPLNGKVHLEKGFMSFTAFKHGLKAAIKKYGISPTTTPMVFHFRITSQGGVKPELTHPFPLSRDYNEMRKLKGDYDVACVHNGIIDFASSYSSVIDYSDTMEFIKEIAFPLIYKNPKWYTNKSVMGMFNYLLSGNRFAIMDGKGHVELIGDWKEDKGIFYSNSTYSYKSSWKSVKTIDLTKSSSWKPYSGSLFDDYEDDYSELDKYPLISKKMEADFFEKGYIECEDCGGEMIIEFLERLGRAVAFCPDCGKGYLLTYTAENYAWNKGMVIWNGDSGYDYDDYDDEDCFLKKQNA